MEYQFVYYNYNYINEDRITIFYSEIHENYLYTIIKIQYVGNNSDPGIRIYGYTVKILKLNSEYMINKNNSNNYNIINYHGNQYKFQFAPYYTISSFDFEINDNWCTILPHVEYDKYIYKKNISMIHQNSCYRQKYKIKFNDKTKILQYTLNNITYYVTNINKNSPLCNGMFDVSESFLFIYINSQNYLIILFYEIYSAQYYMLIIEENKCLIEKKMDKEFNDKISNSIHTFYPTADDNFVVYIIN